ncbi:hypothetical protein F0562_003271 [Nyssa sinensis]|uniref:Uncharacterized protein n=1 Tax=Nyssa sinensis TaxID=561372 RepID=A0A5J5BUT5_9ASTE|nr:hypothetical protein F0562_003271 [Nyssa sinensis]
MERCIWECLSDHSEALAMAGADYRECGIELEAWERCGLEQPPPYLLAEQNRHIEVQKKGADMSVLHDKLLKEKIREWAKAVASGRTAPQLER